MQEQKRKLSFCGENNKNPESWTKCTWIQLNMAKV